ncbi:unnamed protein product [Notodromas monacha]|uniref:ATP phosphoribosyltransferase n=1 Tax=Notodromas monacha TaxID=399045 RepID=A0A7R9C478_9CRUS|nr:unnamed protein product [Notodromas monacha]CAG0925852.1 unnamed protein product [Notodromas monacha]
MENTTHYAGFINIIGNPNVGKSTLMNRLVGEQLAIISAKPQTTRDRILGMVNGDDFQMVFSDTPGVLDPAYPLQANMMDEVKRAIEDADIILLVVQPKELEFQNQALMTQLKTSSTPILILINKIDLIKPDALEKLSDHWHAQIPSAEILPISAKEKVNIDFLIPRLQQLLPVHPAYYPKDQLTDKPEKFLKSKSIQAEIHEISGSVEVAPSIGLAEGICDLVSSGNTLFMNGLKEVEVLLHSEAVLIASPNLSPEKQAIYEQLIFRIEATQRAQQNKYVVLNVPNDKISAIAQVLSGIKSPTVVPLAQEGWSALHSVIPDKDFWSSIDELKRMGAEGILVMPIEKMVL